MCVMTNWHQDSHAWTLGPVKIVPVDDAPFPAWNWANARHRFHRVIVQSGTMPAVADADQDAVTDMTIALPIGERHELTAP